MNEERLSFKARLSIIQNDLQVPKSQRNTFGNYDFRSAEDILSVAKPICQAKETVLTLDDEIILIGDRYYVKSCALLEDILTDDYKKVCASAREELSKKGMDSSQITGSASSYARKYALNGLFNLDDTKDADTDEQHKVTQKETTESKASTNQIKMIQQLLKPEHIYKACEEYNVKELKDLTTKQASELIKRINEKAKK